jgi:uncharacterized protein HemX
MRAIEPSEGSAQDGIVSGRQGPQGDRKMKKSLLALALALGVSSLTFAAVQDTPPSQKDTTKKQSKKKKSNKKAPKKTDGGSNGSASK